MNATQRATISIGPAQPTPAQTRAESFVPLAEILALGAFDSGASPRSQRRIARRWAEKQALRGFALKHTGVWLVDLLAELPGGQTVAQCARERWQPPSPPEPDLPAHWKQTLSETQRAWVVNVIELQRRETALKAQYPRLKGAALEALIIAELGEWARGAGLKLSRRTRDGYYAKLKKRQLPQPRGRKPYGQAECEEACHPDVWAFFRANWLIESQPSIATIWEATAAKARREKKACPSLRYFQLRVKKELPPTVSDLFRKGRKKWERDHGPRIERDYTQYRPMEVLVADHHQCDFVVLDRGRPVRPWLTVWQDMRSRFVVGWELTANPNSDTILLAFGSAVRSYGAPQEILVDNGRDFTSKGVAGRRRRCTTIDVARAESIMERLGIVIHWAKPFHPQSKPVERFFGTFCEDFSKLQGSYCGSCPETRPEDFYRKLRAEEIPVPLIEQTRADIARWLKEVYHLRPHNGDGMDGRTPADVFSEDPIAMRTAPADILALLLLRTQRAKVTRHGIRYNRVLYGQSNPAIWKLQGQEVILRIDPNDASGVTVCDLKGRPVTVATADRLRGLTADDIREGAKRMKAKRKLAKAAMPAMREMHKTSVDYALELKAEYVKKIQATGTDGRAVGDASPRPLALLPGAAELAAAGLRSRSRAAGPPPVEDLPEPEAFFFEEIYAVDQFAELEIKEPELFEPFPESGPEEKTAPEVQPLLETTPDQKPATQGDERICPIDLLGDIE